MVDLKSLNAHQKTGPYTHEALLLLLYQMTSLVQTPRPLHQYEYSLLRRFARSSLPDLNK